MIDHVSFYATDYDTTRNFYAFAAPDRAAVKAFHKTALQVGGHDNGVPGLREVYHANYYGAFVLDPDGNNVEAVCHLAEGENSHQRREPQFSD